MKFLKFLLFIPILIATTPSTIETKTEVNWTDFNTGFQQAQAEGKIAVIDCYTDWCGWCKKMDKNTFAVDSIAKRLNKDYISIKFNPEKPGSYYTGSDTLNGQQLLLALSNNKPGGYPTTFFFVPQTNQMFQVPGYMDAKKFDEMLDNVERYQKAKTLIKK